MYKYEVENTYAISGKAYEIEELQGNITYIVSAECEKPVLIVYERDTKKVCLLQDYVRRKNMSSICPKMLKL